MTKITDSHHSVWLGRTGICKRGKLKIQSSAMPVISNEFKQITHREKTSILYTQYCLSNDRTIFQLPLSLCGKIHVSTWIKTPLICELTEMNKGLPMFMTSTNTQTHTHTHTLTAGPGNEGLSYCEERKVLIHPCYSLAHPMKAVLQLTHTSYSL